MRKDAALAGLRRKDVCLERDDVGIALVLGAREVAVVRAAEHFENGRAGEEEDAAVDDVAHKGLGFLGVVQDIAVFVGGEAAEIDRKGGRNLRIVLKRA